MEPSDWVGGRQVPGTMSMSVVRKIQIIIDVVRQAEIKHCLGISRVAS